MSDKIEHQTWYRDGIFGEILKNIGNGCHSQI